MSHHSTLRFALALAGSALVCLSSALTQTPRLDPCPDIGTRFVMARADANAWITCSGSTIQVNGIVVRTGSRNPGACPTIVTYYPAHYEAGEPKKGMQLGPKHRLPIQVFTHECRGSYLLFLYLGESCEPTGRFESGWVESWDEAPCQPRIADGVEG